MSTKGPQQSSEIAIRLIIPAIDSLVDLIRTAVGRVAQLIGFTFDGIEDFALAANEAAALLLDLGPHTLEVDFHAPLEHGDRATVVISAVDPKGQWPPPDLEVDLRWQVLTAICEDVRVRDDGHCGLVLVQGMK